MYLKVMNAAMERQGYTYKIGKNNLKKIKDTEGKPYYCYFTTEKAIFHYLNYGPWVSEITVDEKNVEAAPEDDNSYDKTIGTMVIPGFRSRIVEIGKPVSWSVKLIENLIEEGALMGDLSWSMLLNLYIWSIQSNADIYNYLNQYVKDRYRNDVHSRLLNICRERGFL